MAQPAPEVGNVCGGKVTEPSSLREMGYAHWDTENQFPLLDNSIKEDCFVFITLEGVVLGTCFWGGLMGHQ